MDWGKVIMDSIVVAIIGLIAVVVSGIITDFKWYKKIADKIGNHKSDTLEGQHENIKNTLEKAVIERSNGIEKVQNSEFARIFNKVDSIDKEMVANKERYNSLNIEQKDIRNNINKLVNEWEHAIVENKELKIRIKEIEIKNRELENKYKGLLFRYRKDRHREDIMEI